ncbi:trans-sulfuration enzyme family protein [Pendulispora albinea]|uniref:Aminotransferase class I/II-fold pyridoxal phosphate-dependent enzyme n=1 Tax=Pendulispora albinea TaxID=2741071 RepID=A0ABZ2LN46_9BACT
MTSKLESHHDIATVAIHGGEARERAHDAVTTPIVCTATYTFSSTDALRDHFEGRVEREEYGRYGNPTVRTAERKLATLDGAEDCVLFSSGMAALTTTLLAMVKSGDHIVLTSDVYRRTRQFVGTFLSKFGVESTLVPAGDVDACAAAIVPGKTKLLITESPTNPYLRLADIPRLAALKKSSGARGLKLLVDSTFATPINQRPIELGADLVVHSCTKYLGGHNDLLAGSVAGSEALVSALRDTRGVLGGVLDPHAAYLLLRGIKTLALRVERQNQTALRVAQWLEAHPGIERVYYPGLASHPDAAIAGQMRGHGGVVSFLVRGDLESTSKFIDACSLATIAPSLGGVETLIEQPALMSHYELTTEQRLAIGIRENLVRLSVGLEDADDLIVDFSRALATIASSPAVVNAAKNEKPEKQEQGEQEAVALAKSKGVVESSKVTRRVEEAVSHVR